MKHRILNSTPALFTPAKSPARRRSKARSFAQRMVSSLQFSNRDALPFGTLWDPTLLDRLHTPLTRHHE